MHSDSECKCDPHVINQDAQMRHHAYVAFVLFLHCYKAFKDWLLRGGHKGGS